MNLTIDSPTVFTSLGSINLLAYSPTINLQGTLNSSEVLVSLPFYAEVNQPPYGYSLQRASSPFDIQGNVTINGTSFEDAYVINSLTGDWHLVDPYPVNTWQITWNNLLHLILSPLDAVLLTGIAAIAISEFVLSRKSGKIG